MSHLERFDRNWLFETPMSTGYAAHDPYPDLVNTLEFNLSQGNEKEKVNDLLYKSETPQTVMYWVEKNNVVEIIAEFEKVPSGLFVELIGKREGSSVYANEFYLMVLNDANRLLFSGNVLSVQGFGIWKRLFNDGKQLFVYNVKHPMDKQVVNSIEDLEKYMGQTPDFKNYRFVLSENAQLHAQVISDFEICRIYHLTHNLEI